MSTIEVLLVGAGPIGIELAVALEAAGIRYAHLDAGQIGSTIAWYAPNTHFFSSPERIAIAGVPLLTLDQTKATREEYLTYLRSVVLQFDLKINTYERVISLERHAAGGFTVVSRRTAGERHWHASNVVLAIGDMHHPTLLGVPGEDLPHVSHYFGDPHLYFRKRVLIAGGKNSAVEAAIRCVRVGAEVTLSYRGAELDPARIKYWLLPDIRSMIREGRMTFLPRTSVCEILPDRVILTTEGDDSSPRSEIEADFVLLLTGYEQDPQLLLQAGVTLIGPERRPFFDEATMETNVPHLFVAGTATAGTQRSGVKEFIETSHVHVGRILAALTGAPPPPDAQPEYEIPES
ncbi:MAG TPA: NAD(P)-binding domain-containing protein [Thermoanaerobaculia bacterium]|nr:NAD(P)-binding domain-containing protein [Thermoanaerobaculia bacterium]